MIETERLVLRAWRDDDRAPFAEMGRDPQVMATLGPLMTREDSDAAIDRMMAYQAAHGHCFWPVERREDGMFLGFCGLKQGPDDTPIAGETEIGWRLRSDMWGRGYAREAAEATLAWGWAHLDRNSIYAITTPDNSRSWGLMERLGMTRRHDLDFDHPGVPDDSQLKAHLTYAASRPR
ncbi:GCN5 family acetyltransferase [Sphingomonas antarctica]|uniref:GNAT family N-acetyltransferase n=1 Tax=Sphingomonas antarctica TaxID=2040274 RepID=UPI0039EA046F